MKSETLLLFVFLISILILSFVKGMLSTSKEFEIKPDVLRLNWTNNYQANLTITSTFNITLVFNNSTTLKANYSQGSEIELIVKNQTGDFDNTTTINTSESNFTIFTVIANIKDKMPGKYKGIFSVENSTNSSENTSIEIVVDLPIEINGSTGIGSFNGTLPPNASEYHSFYFNSSTFPNVTSITLNVSFVGGDLDLFLLSGGELKSKSIGNENEEKLSYSFINPNATYEIRIYGYNSSSGIPYNGSVALLSLSSSKKEIDFGSKNVSLKEEKTSLDLTNEGNVTIENVSESLEFYYLKKFDDTNANNFTFFLPNSSVFEKIKVRLIWNGTVAYNLSLFNSSGIKVGESSGKYLNANMSNVEREEFVEVNNSDKAGWWRAEVKNNSANFSSYQLIVQAFANASKWIKTNFSDYENKTFDVIGSENSKKIELNLTTPVDAITGNYEGFLIYSAANGGQLKIPIKLSLINRLNVTILKLENETANLTFQPHVNVTFLLAYVDGTKISPSDSPLDFTKNISVWLYEPNASYLKKNLTFSDISNSTDWKINLTLPKIPGGRYYVRINLTSYTYQGESSDSQSNLLTVEDVGLDMNLGSFPSSLSKNSTGYVNVTIKNLGPLNATNAKIKIIKGDCLSSASFSSSNCLRSSSGEEVTFNISAYNYTGCYIVWKITAGTEEGSCTTWINGTAGSWFENISFDTDVYSETTTTTIPSIPTTTTTSTTSTTTTTTTTTTSTTLPQQPIAGQRIEISNISPNLPATINIPQVEILKIQKIIIAVNKNLSNVVLNVKEGSKPEGASPPLKEGEGLVLKYLEISTNLNESDVANVTIEFQVEKAWVETNDIDANTIALYKYSNNTWNKLPTSKINETMNHYHFKSISQSFSVFAIAGFKARRLPSWVFFLIVGAIIAAILAFLFWPVEERRREKAPFQKTEEKKEEIQKPWEELKKKWEELMKRREKKST
jgi:PGF-pre-PGF domain-containing protein